MKPNTKFLKNLLKGTESHNTALLAKEAAESQAKLDELQHTEEKRRRKYKPEAHDIRKRQLGDIKSILNGRPIQQRSGSPEDCLDKRIDTPGEIRNRAFSSFYKSGQNIKSSDRNRKRHRDFHDCNDYHIERYPHHDQKADRRKRHKIRSPSPARPASENERSRHFCEQKKHKQRDSKIQRDWSAERTSKQREKSESDSDSDLLGPMPYKCSKVQRRGRGIGASASGIERRFSASYDPQDDIGSGSGEDYWSDKVEAYKNRQKWKQKGAERLREAGFSESEIKRWETGGEKRLEDVKWSKRGEKREWDRGKVVGPDGTVSFNTEWAQSGSTSD